MIRVCSDCSVPESHAHQADCQIQRSKLQKRKETLGKRTSEGYEPSVDEKVEVRGD